MSAYLCPRTSVSTYLRVRVSMCPCTDIYASYHVMSCNVTSCHVIKHHVMSCDVMSCDVMSCRVMSCKQTYNKQQQTNCKQKASKQTANKQTAINNTRTTNKLQLQKNYVDTYVRASTNVSTYLCPRTYTYLFPFVLWPSPVAHSFLSFSAFGPFS